MMTTRRAGWMLVLSMVAFGTIGLCTVNAAMPAMSITFWRCVFAGAALLVVCTVTGAFKRTRPTRRAVLLTIVGGVALVANWLLLTTAFQRTSITTATVAYHSEPFFLVLLGAALTKSMPTRREWLWLVVAACGLVLGTGMVTSDGLDAGMVDTGGVLAATLAGMLYAVATLAAQRTAGIDPAVMTLMQVGVGALLLAPFASALDLRSSGWMWVATMGVVHTGILYAVMYAALPALRVPVVAAIAFVNPAVAVLIDATGLGNRPTALELVGVAAIIVATLGTTVPTRRGNRDFEGAQRRLEA